MDKVQILNVEGLAKDSHEGARVERSHVRTKTYIKDFAFCLKHHPREWPYLGIPGLAAAQALGVPLTECNEAGIMNFARCQFGCWFCFAGELMDAGADVVEEVTIADLWEELMDQRREDAEKGNPWHIIRATGGEPMLQQDELVALLEWRHHQEPEQFYFWLDTNLGVMPTEETLTRFVEVGEPMGVVGCFKGFTPADVQDNTDQAVVTLEDQFAVAYAWERSGLDVYYYVVDSTSYGDHPPLDLAKGFIDKMRYALGPTAPLKTCVLEIKDHYACATREKPDYLETNRVGPSVWLEALRSFYSDEELWTPPHMLRCGGRDG